MLPHWLASVAWAFDRFRTVDVPYGARIVQDERAFAVPGRPSRVPRVVTFDRDQLTECTYIDMNVLEHVGRRLVQINLRAG